MQARFNEDITDALAQACLGELERWASPAPTSSMSACPARSKCRSRCRPWPERSRYHALVALGCIIRGETYHFELVANESGAGVSRIALDHRMPIANAILTTENLEQAVARQSDKGRDAARVAVEMARLLADPHDDDLRPTSATCSIAGDNAAKHRRSTGLTSTGARKASAKSTRSRAREFALQALYQHLVGRNEAAVDRRVHARPRRLPQGRRGALRRAAAWLDRRRRPSSTR